MAICSYLLLAPDAPVHKLLGGFFLVDMIFTKDSYSTVVIRLLAIALQKVFETNCKHFFSLITLQQLNIVKVDIFVQYIRQITALTFFCHPYFTDCTSFKYTLFTKIKPKFQTLIIFIQVTQGNC